jgi:hypothetical protein
MELGGSFLGIEAAGGMMPTSKLHLLPRLKMCDAILHSSVFHCVVFKHRDSYTVTVSWMFVVSYKIVKLTWWSCLVKCFVLLTDQTDKWSSSDTNIWVQGATVCC